MPTAISRTCTVRLSPDHHPSIPSGGLVLRAGIPTRVTRSQAGYLRTLDLVEILPGPQVNPTPEAETPAPTPLHEEHS